MTVTLNNWASKNNFYANKYLISLKDSLEIADIYKK